MNMEIPVKPFDNIIPRTVLLAPPTTYPYIGLIGALAIRLPSAIGRSFKPPPTQQSLPKGAYDEI